MNIIYLAAYKAQHQNRNIVYQDINGLRDIAGDTAYDLSKPKGSKKIYSQKYKRYMTEAEERKRIIVVESESEKEW